MSIVLEAQLQSVLDRLSNDEPVDYQDEWIEEAGEQFKQALRKQLTRDNREFRLRMSNVGRPLCQLQMEKAGAAKVRQPYNFVVRMLLGDASEVLLRLFIKMAGINVTSHGDKVKWTVAGTDIKGESDIDIGDKVYDIKSSSPWGFDHKWRKGYKTLAADDTFGYLGQLVGYSEAQEKDPGGWIVLNKSSGEIAVVPFEGGPMEQELVRTDAINTVHKLVSNAPFKRCYEAEEETYYGKKTGAKRLGKICEMCDFMGSCWPEARKRPQPKSKAKNPPFNWYVEYPEPEAAE